MASPMEVAILLLTACATFHFSDAKATHIADRWKSDNDAIVKLQEEPTETAKGCNSTSTEDRRKDESNVDAYVGPQTPKSEFGKIGKLQTPYETGENEISTGKNPDLTNNGPLNECSNFPFPVDPPTLDNMREAQRIHTNICQKLSYYSRCILGGITSFELKEKDMFGDRHFHVTANHGKLFGLANFGDNYNFTQSNLTFQLRWKNLRMIFSLTTDEKGKTDVRSVEVSIPLRMRIHVLQLAQGYSRPSVEMSQAEEHELIFISTNSEFPLTATEWAYKIVKHRITDFINDKLRKFIYYSVLEVFNFGKGTSPLCEGRDEKVYKD